MGIARSSWSVALTGLEGHMVEIEAAVGGGLPRTVLVGLPDASLYEARDRCRAAIASVGCSWPQHLLTINLTPATLPKAGSHYDLGIVASVLAAAEFVPDQMLDDTVLLGELGLDGRVRPVRGVLPAVLAAVQHGFEKVIVPSTQVVEAELVDGVSVIGVGTLEELVEVLHGRLENLPPLPEQEHEPAGPTDGLDLGDVVGQLEARWALEVAAAGRHHLFLGGPPGVGKTMLAERLPGILPDLSVEEALEVAAIRSLAGREPLAGLSLRPPYSDPHHSASVPSLVGGGARIARPGAISLAHRGVLFLDEAAEFQPRALEALRTPLEKGRITLGRTEQQAIYPARFQLVLAANPCPCGRYGTTGAACTCSPMAVRRYRERLSGPILDRIDVHQTLRPLRKGLLKKALQQRLETSAQVAERVAQARERQAYRYAGTGWLVNAEVPGPYLRMTLPIPDGVEIIDDAVRRGSLSARGVDKVLRLAWSIGDLAGHDRPNSADVRLALSLRRGEVIEKGALAS